MYDILKSSRIAKIHHQYLTKIIFLFDTSSKICIFFWTMHLEEREHPHVFNIKNIKREKGLSASSLDGSTTKQQVMAWHHSGLCEQERCQCWTWSSLRTYSSCKRGGRSLQQGIGRLKSNLCLPSDNSKA